MSNQAGQANLIRRLAEMGITARKGDPALARILETVKAREAEGYSYDTAQASFELLARAELGQLPEFFEVKRYRVTVERRKNKYNEMTTLSEAVVVVKIGGQKMLSVSESMDETGSDRGPVNALSKALAKDLGPYQSIIDDMKLVDFKVRITQGGTEAVTRVTIDSEDCARPPLGHRRRLPQHRRRLLRGAARRHQLEARPRRRRDDRGRPVSDAFHRLYSDIPRAGPGEPDDIRWALATAGTPQGARILDAGCGPGGDIATLLEHPGARVTAVDSHPPFIAAIRARYPQVTAFAGDMATAEGPFDFIWCAGALYFLGLASGLAAFRPRLAEDGAIAFSEPCLFTDTPVRGCESLLGRLPRPHANPASATTPKARATASSPPAASPTPRGRATTRPLLARAAALQPGADPDLLRVILAAEAEAALWARVKRETGYLLVLARPA